MAVGQPAPHANLWSSDPMHRTRSPPANATVERYGHGVDGTCAELCIPVCISFVKPAERLL
jgi:hypothetical protein